jgi:asparagine synthetase B (glutamine-hydrolysing)
MRILSRSDIREENLLTFVRDGWLPIPESIIPPQRENFLWDTLPLQAYDSKKDYPGRLLDNLRSAIRRTICEWDDLENTDRVGVWLSGGIDSSTLLYLTCEILGPEKVRAYSVNLGDENEVERAKLIADRCDVRLAMKEMTAEDSIHLTEETVLCLRGPVDTTHVVFASRLCSEDGTGKILSALGLDELQAGYPEHVNATDDEFCEVEANLLWKCQSSWAWAQRMGSRKHVDVKFPFLRRELIAWCRGLPRTHKCVDRDTKVRLRKELSRTLIPEHNREAGRTAGTKGGFCPILEKWFEHELKEWSNENLPPNGLTSQTRFKIDNMIKGYLWRTWRAATINTFLRLLDEGKFDYEERL